MSAGGPHRPPATRRELARFLDLVEEVARAVLRRRRLPLAKYLDDAIQDGFEGLARAFDRYDEDKGACFEAYARPCIKGAILDALDREKRANALKKLLAGADDAAADFAAGHEIRDAGIETPEGGQRAARKAAEGYLTALGVGFLCAIGKLDPEAILSARRDYAYALDVLQGLLGRLAAREQTVLLLRTIEGYAWEDVAEHMDRPRQTVQNWHTKAMDQLRRGLALRGIEGMPRLPDRDDEEEEEEE